MRPIRTEAARAATNRMFYLHEQLKRHSENVFLRTCGYSELNVARLPDKWYSTIYNGFERGFVSGLGKGWPVIMNMIESLHGVSVGYVGRTAFRVAFPNSAPVSEYMQGMITLMQVETGKLEAPFLMREHGDNEILVTAHFYVNEEGPPPAKFTRVRVLAESYLAEHKSHRQPVLDWLETKPTVKVPFRSHTNDWSPVLK